MRSILPILSALLVSSPSPTAQTEGGYDLPVFHLQAHGKDVPKGTRVRALIVRSIGKTIEIEALVGEKGQLELRLERESGLLPRGKIQIHVDFLPDEFGQKKKVWYYASQRFDYRLPGSRLTLSQRKAFLVGTGRLMDAEGSGVEAARIKVTVAKDGKLTGIGLGTNTGGGNPEILDTKGPGFHDLWLLGNIRTNRLGQFELWSTRPVFPSDKMAVGFSKKSLVGMIRFDLKPGGKNQEFQLPPMHALAFVVPLPRELPLKAMGFRVRHEQDGHVTYIPASDIRMLEEKEGQRHWIVTFDPLPTGQCRLQITTGPGTVIVSQSKTTTITDKGIEYPLDSNLIKWAGPLFRIKLQVCDIEGSPLSESCVSTHPRNQGELAHYAMPTDEQGKVTMVRILGDDTFVYWAHGYRVKKDRDPQSGQKVKLKPVPKITFVIPELFSAPRDNLEIWLRLDPQFSTRTPMPPEQVRDWWYQPIDKNGHLSMSVGWYGALEPFLVLVNKKTGEAWQIPGMNEAPLRRLDRRKTKVELDFDFDQYTTALDELGIK